MEAAVRLEGRVAAPDIAAHRVEAGLDAIEALSGHAQIAIAEEYLAPFGNAVRDKVMLRNALAFYRRHKRERHQRD